MEDPSRSTTRRVNRIKETDKRKRIQSNQSGDTLAQNTILFMCTMPLIDKIVTKRQQVIEKTRCLGYLPKGLGRSSPKCLPTERGSSAIHPHGKQQLKIIVEIAEAGN